ncbi:hypothetical protein V6N12_053029 [Hibiscus sabdariffa]|uniref:Reverse transcriptase zinc-binding domain-containing protein n=1 Tax=Hibiscus sabdariffa TaxID=183260 RepID=A0ABR1ZGZ8_9ROSI
MCRCNSWSWEIHLRRRLFDWEVPSWNELLALLSSFHSSRLGRDWLQWIGSSDGIYSIKAMKAQLYSSHSSVVNWEKVVWNGLAPPKVEAFMWLILHERVPVKMELLKRGRILATLELDCEVLGCSLVLHRNPRMCGELNRGWLLLRLRGVMITLTLSVSENVYWDKGCEAVDFGFVQAIPS